MTGVGLVFVLGRALRCASIESILLLRCATGSIAAGCAGGTGVGSSLITLLADADFARGFFGTGMTSLLLARVLPLADAARAFFSGGMTSWLLALAGTILAGKTGVSGSTCPLGCLVAVLPRSSCNGWTGSGGGGLNKTIRCSGSRVGLGGFTLLRLGG